MIGLIGPETENDAESYVTSYSKCFLKSVKTWWSGYVPYTGEVENTRFFMRRLEERGPFMLRLWKGVV
jgi:hypothetical protein